MDPFSLAVGIAGLASLAATTVKLAKEYVSSVKHAKESATALIGELEALQSNLSSLDGFLRKLSPGDLTFQHTSALRSCASTCETKLNTLCKKLGRVSEGKISRYLWPLSKEEHKETVRELQAFGKWIQFALTVDGCALLSRTSAEVLEVFEQQVKSFRVLKKIEDDTSWLHNTVKDQTLMLQEDRDAKEKAQVLTWISKVEYDQKHHAVRSPRVEGTGGWLLKEPTYTQWRDDFETSNILWCHGDPGSGKSVLTSLVIDDLQGSINPQGPVVFLYLDYQDQESQTPCTILSSLLKQIAVALPELPKCVIEAYGKHHESKTAISVQELEELLLTISSTLSSLFVVLDALDECDEVRYRKPLLQFIRRLKQNKNVRLFVTSRPHLQDLNTVFQDCPQIEVQAHDSDLRSYIEQELSFSDVAIDDTLTSYVIEKVLSNAHGMFLLPILQLRTVLKEPTAGEMEDALQNLSTSLSEAFAQTVARINRLPENRKRLGTNALIWICHSRRPLTVSELSDALSVRPDQSERSPKHCPAASVIIECCQGLVTVEPETSIIRLAHKAVQDYLVAPENDLLLDAEASMAATCLTYLLFEPFKQGPLIDRDDIEDRIEEHPLLNYATVYCRYHTLQAQSYEGIRRLTIEFLYCRGATSSANQVRQYMLRRRKEYWDPEECNSMTALHVACSYGLEIIVRKLLALNSFPVDLKTKMGTTPLIKAASAGHASVVRLLLQAGADPYLENWYGNALHCAAEAGHIASMSELVRSGMDPNQCERYSRSPLSCTLDNDHAEAFEALVDLGANINAINDGDSDDSNLYDWGYNLSAFHFAVQVGCIKIIELILRKKWANIDSQSHHGFTALHFSAMSGNTQVLRRLLEAGANINATDYLGLTPLDYAIKFQNGDSIRLLDINATVAIYHEGEYKHRIAN